MQPRHVLESQQFNYEFLEKLFSSADKMRDRVKKKDKKLSSILKDKIMCTLFYEPSTRTRMSFESAMLRLGGNVISTENASEFTSVYKGESLVDTIRIIDDYCDVIVLRSDKDDGAHVASTVSDVPIINAGEGKLGQHPTQALLDVYTLKKEVGEIDQLNIAIVGDLKNGRTVKSLAYLLGKCGTAKIHFVSPNNFKVGGDITDYLQRHNTPYTETESLESILPEVDAVYMTRLQKERMTAEEYLKAGMGGFKMTNIELEKMKPTARLLHPLPHVEEIQICPGIEEIDKRVAYFRQAENGLYIRMALLEHILSSK